MGNTGYAKINGDKIECFKVLTCQENIGNNIFCISETCKRTRGHDFTIVKGQVAC